MNRSKTSPDLSSFVATTATMLLAEPLTCAVYCLVNIDQRKHHSRVQAPVAISHSARAPPAPYTQAQIHTKKRTQ